MLNTINHIIMSPAGSFICVLLLMFLVGWSIHTITKKIVTWSEGKKAAKLERDVETIKTDVRKIKEMISKMG